MPLFKSASKKAMSKNIESEMDSGKPQPQSIAMAYGMKRQSQKKKMAQGGEITAKDESRADADKSLARSNEMLRGAKLMSAQEKNFKDDSMSEDSIDGAMDEREMRMRKYAQGGEVDLRKQSMSGNSIDDARDEMELDMMMAKGGLVDAIMKKRKMMAQGGEVDLQENGDEDLNNLDDMNYAAARKDAYFDDSQLSDQPEDSNLKGDELSDEDSHDMVSSIRKKMRSRI